MRSGCRAVGATAMALAVLLCGSSASRAEDQPYPCLYYDIKDRTNHSLSPDPSATNHSIPWGTTTSRIVCTGKGPTGLELEDGSGHSVPYESQAQRQWRATHGNLPNPF